MERPDFSTRLLNSSSRETGGRYEIGAGLFPFLSFMPPRLTCEVNEQPCAILVALPRALTGCLPTSNNPVDGFPKGELTSPFGQGMLRGNEIPLPDGFRESPRLPDRNAIAETLHRIIRATRALMIRQSLGKNIRQGCLCQGIHRGGYAGDW